jgi:phosphate transport system ATP-binding protein
MVELKAASAVKMAIQDWTVWYRVLCALRAISLDIRAHEILGIIGPANSGKTSLLRSLNRMNDILPAFRYTGGITLDGKDLYRELDSQQVRYRVGIVFALPLPLPLSIRENVTYGPRLRGERDAWTGWWSTACRPPHFGMR